MRLQHAKRIKVMVIPVPVLLVVAEVMADAYTWTVLEGQFLEAGAPDCQPDGSSKAARCMAWLRHINEHTPNDALPFLGRLTYRFMEEVMPGEEGGQPPAYRWGSPNLTERRKAQRDRLRLALKRAGLSYAPGGQIVGAGGHVATRQLHDLIRVRDLPALQAEFETLAQRAASHPRDALSASANIVEAVLGELIAAWNLPGPSKRTLNTLWATVKPALNADPSAIPDPDIAKVAGAMAAMVDGLQGLRDDKSRAHAMKPELARNYRIEGRHARLVVNSALALTVFVLEAWEAADERRQSIKPP